MTRSEFVFTIGFLGDAALVDKRAMRLYSKLGTMELARKGLSRAAFCSALHSADEREMAEFVEFFGRQAGVEGLTADRLKRLFGIYTVPEDVTRTIVV